MNKYIMRIYLKNNQILEILHNDKDNLEIFNEIENCNIRYAAVSNNEITMNLQFKISENKEDNILLFHLPHENFWYFYNDTVMKKDIIKLIKDMK